MRIKLGQGEAALSALCLTHQDKLRRGQTPYQVAVELHKALLEINLGSR